jgi:colanic acid biosynthesis glycosyl transferase WcaI
MLLRAVRLSNGTRRHSKPRRLIFANRYFHPDQSATSRLLSDLAFHLAAKGWDVTVIASRQRYDDAMASLPESDRTGGVEITRVWTTRFGRASLPGRAIDYATFYCSAFFALLRSASRGAVVVAKTDPPMLGVLAAFVTSLTGMRLVQWLQDLFPEVAIASRSGLRALSLLTPLRDWSLRRSSRNVALSESMKRRVVEAGAGAVVRPNWFIEETSGSGRRDEIRSRMGASAGQLLIGYSGNLGRAHDAETILETMTILRLDDAIRFVIVGGGARYGWLRSQAEARKLTNVEFLPYFESSELFDALASTDLQWVSLLPEMEGMIVPSKIYGILAVGRGTIFIGSADGSIGRLILEHDAGEVFRPGDAPAIAARIRKMTVERKIVERYGSHARALHDVRYSREVALQEWEEILSEAAAEGREGDFPWR